ncbi:MAG: alpha/beta hydrolase-fold protein [Acidobacteriota bacterium]
MSFTRISPFLTLALLGTTASLGLALAQGLQAPPVASPEVLPDHRVVFRIWAPKAEEVILRGDWMQGTAVERLIKGDDGVWSITVGPLRPDYYSYTLVVDGVRTLDPQNPEIKQGVRSVDNMFFVPGPEAEYQALKTVPHGQIRKIWYESTTLGGTRRMHVYTPPGYDQSGARYPVLYLLHGGGDDDSGWSTIGRAGLILDNLLAAGKARPMLIVMPNGSIPLPPDLPRFTPGQSPPEAFTRAMNEAQQKFVSELMRDVIPYVEKNLRAAATAESRAIAGLSMGGGHTLSVFSSHPGEFAYVAIWSAGLWRDPEGWEEAHRDFLQRAKDLPGLRLLLIQVGEDDFALPGARALSELFKKYGIAHEFRLSGGGHTWLNWRAYLHELLPRLFR